MASCAPGWRRITPRSNGHARSTPRPQATRRFGSSAVSSSARRSPAEDLLERYHAVVYAFGTATDKRLGIRGEDRPGSYAATEFVAWYNGHPHFADHEFDLNGEPSGRDRERQCRARRRSDARPRPLAKSRQPIPPTTRSTHSAIAGVTEVIVLGRRGPPQAAFTNPELRRARRAQPRRRDRRSPRSSSTTLRRGRAGQAHAGATWRSSGSTRSAGRPARRIAWSSASCARRSRSSVTARPGRSPGSGWGQPDRHERDGRVTRGADRRRGGDRVRAGPALDRISRTSPIPGVPFDERCG